VLEDLLSGDDCPRAGSLQWCPGVVRRTEPRARLPSLQIRSDLSVEGHAFPTHKDGGLQLARRRYGSGQPPVRLVGLCAPGGRRCSGPVTSQVRPARRTRVRMSRRPEFVVHVATQ